jgi:osmotically-inducible protein OsmY
VLNATDWFTDPQVRVEEGVVFINGQVESDELKKWAGDLARNTQDVVAAVNRPEVSSHGVSMPDEAREVADSKTRVAVTDGASPGRVLTTRTGRPANAPAGQLSG